MWPGCRRCWIQTLWSRRLGKLARNPIGQQLFILQPENPKQFITFQYAEVIFISKQDQKHCGNFNFANANLNPYLLFESFTRSWVSSCIHGKFSSTPTRLWPGCRRCWIQTLWSIRLRKLAWNLASYDSHNVVNLKFHVIFFFFFFFLIKASGRNIELRVTL